MVRILDATTGAEQQAVKSRMVINSASFSADGARLLTAGYQNVAEMEGGFETTGSAVQEWVVHPSKGPAPDGSAVPDPELHGGIVVWSADGNRQAGKLYKGKDDDTEIRIRDRAGKQILVFSEHTAQVATTSFSPDGRLVFSRAYNGEVKIWETNSGKVRWEANVLDLFQRYDSKSIWKFNASVVPASGGIAFSPDGRFLTLPSPGGVRIVNTGDFREVSLVEGTSAALFPWPNCFFSPDSRRLIVLKSPPLPIVGKQPVPLQKWQMKLWDVDARRAIEPALFEDQSNRGQRGHLMAFSPDSRFFAIDLARQGVAIFDTATGKQRSVLKVPGAGGMLTPLAILFSPDGARVVMQTSGGPLGEANPGPTVWDTATGKFLFRLEGHDNVLLLRMAFSPDGTRIATADVGGFFATKVWDAATGRMLLSLKNDQVPRPPQVTTLSFSPDGHRLMLQTRDGQGPSWDATPRAEEPK